MLESVTFNKKSHFSGAREIVQCTVSKAGQGSCLACGKIQLPVALGSLSCTRVPEHRAMNKL